MAEAKADVQTATAAAPSPSVESKEPVTATGRRREAIARVRLMPGTGAVRVNGRAFEDYFPRESLRLMVNSPLVLTHQIGKRDLFIRVEGGGLNGQAGAIKMGIARALVKLDQAHHGDLRGAGMLTRDPRMKERKKYGRKGARRRFQWTKR